MFHVLRQHLQVLYSFLTFNLMQADGLGGSALLPDPSLSSQPSQTSQLLGFSKEHQQGPWTQFAANTTGRQGEQTESGFCDQKVVLFEYFVSNAFYVFVVSASSSLGCFGPCVLSLHPSVYPTQQPEAHTSRHSFCLSRTLHHPTTPQQREPDHLHRKGRISWTRQGHQMDQWGKTKLWPSNCILQVCSSLDIFLSLGHF